MFTRQRSNVEYTALLDIGSGSVTASLICSDLQRDQVEIVWTYHERLLLKQVAEARTQKPLLTSLLNCLLALGNDGIQALHSYDSGAHIRSIQVGVSAPWSYTVTKNVRVNKDTPFTINQNIIDDLREAAEKKIKTEIDENEVARQLELAVVTRSVTDLRANDYPISGTGNHTAKSVSMTLSSVIIQEYLHQAILESCEKVLPKADLHIYSAMLQFYFTLGDINPEMKEYCVVNLTLEATEIGVVRNGVLAYSTHEPYGLIHIARDISNALNVPVSEVYGQLQADELSVDDESLSKKTKAAITDVYREYQKRIADLFAQTGDDFTIPRSLYMSCAVSSQRSLITHIEAAAQLATGFQHILHPIGDRIVTKNQSELSDTGIERISGQFFHRFGYDTRFTFL